MFSSRQLCARALMAVGLTVFMAFGSSRDFSASAAPIPGTIVVGARTSPFETSVGDNRLVAVDPTTGATSVLSGDGVGTGPSFDFAGNNSAISYITQQADGSLLVVDSADLSSGPYESRLYRVDPRTGNRSIVADITSSSSEGVIWAALQVGNTIFATTGTGLETIDPTTGSVTPFAVSGVSFPLYAARGLAASGGYLYCANSDLYKINIATGLGSVLASSNGTSINSFDVSVDSAGHLYALSVGNLTNPDGTMTGTGGVYKVDPTTGDRVALSVTSNATPPGAPTVGTGPLLQALSMTTTPSGDILTMNVNGGLLSIDPTTGDRTLISQVENVSVFKEQMDGIVVLTNVPEPGTAILAALSGLALLLRFCRKLKALCAGYSPELS